MNELEARLDLLKVEYAELHSTVRHNDQLVQQVKGWTVTTAVATAGLAFQFRAPGVALLGLLATVLYLAVEAQRKMLQRRHIDRLKAIEDALFMSSVEEALLSGRLVTPYSTGGFVPVAPFSSLRQRERWAAFLREMLRVNTFLLYAAVGVLLLATVIVVALGLPPVD